MLILVKIGDAYTVQYVNVRICRRYWMMGVKSIEKIRNEDIIANAGVANIREAVWRE